MQGLTVVADPVICYGVIASEIFLEQSLNMSDRTLFGVQKALNPAAKCQGDLLFARVSKDVAAAAAQSATALKPCNP